MLHSAALLDLLKNLFMTFLSFLPQTVRPRKLLAWRLILVWLLSPQNWSPPSVIILVLTCKKKKKKSSSVRAGSALLYPFNLSAQKVSQLQIQIPVPWLLPCPRALLGPPGCWRCPWVHGVPWERPNVAHFLPIFPIPPQSLLVSTRCCRGWCVPPCRALPHPRGQSRAWALDFGD